MSTVSNTDSCLSFRVGQEIFAASVAYVHEILELTKITKIPHAPAFMKGVTNLRGTVLPVVDTRIKFGLPAPETTQDACIIVLNITANDKKILIGALVDAVIEVVSYSVDEVKPLPSIGSKYNTDFIKGTTKMGDDFVLFLDIDRVFSSDELIQVQDSGNA